MQALGLGADSTDETLARLERDSSNLIQRLQSQGVDTTKKTDESSLLTKILRGANLPGAGVRSTLRELVDNEPGFNVQRAYNKDTLWNKQTEFNDVLNAMGLLPENKFARGALNFVGDVATDPLTFLSGGITSGLKFGVPFGKATQITAKGLGQVAKVVPYLDEGKVVAKTIPDAFTRLFKGKTDEVTKELIPGPLKGISDFLGPMFSTTYGKDARLVNARKALETNLRNTASAITKTIYDISKRHGLTEAEDNLLRRLAEEPAQREAMGVVATHAPTGNLSSLSPEFQQGIMRALPELQDVGARITPNAETVTLSEDARHLLNMSNGDVNAAREVADKQVSNIRSILKKSGDATVDEFQELLDFRRRWLGIAGELKRHGSELGGSSQELSQSGIRPELLTAFNELQSVTREMANIPEAARGWLKAKGAAGEGTEMLDDYIKHELTQVEPPMFGARKIGTVQDPSLLPREQGTIEELNKLRKTPFEGRMTVATAARALKAQYAVKSFDWVKQQLLNPEWAKVLDEDYIAKLVSKLPEDQAVKQAERLSKVVAGDKVGDLITWQGGGKLRDLGKHLVTPELFEVLTHVDKRYVNMTDEGVKNFLTAVDWATNKWRPLVTLRNPAFHVNNALGNLWNMYLGDVNPLDMPKLLRQGYDAIANNPGTVKLGKIGTVGLDELKGYALEAGGIGHQAIWEASGVRGLKEQLSNLSGAQRAGALTRLGQGYDDAMRKVGIYTEDGSKMALFIDAMSKLEPLPEVLQAGGREAALREMAQRAAAHVKKYLFDYGDLTEVERTVFRRFLPFYSWTRKNLPLQITEILKQPGKFAKIRHAKASTEQMSDEPNSPKPAFLNEAIRLPFSMDGGKSPVYFNPRIPAQDISRIPFIGPGDTGREMAGMLHPLPKTLLELTFNKSLFNNRDIERFKGETVGVLGGGRVPAKVAYAVNSTLGVYGKTGAALQAFAPDATPTDKLRLVRAVFPGLYTFDEEKEKANAAYTEVNRLRDLLRKYEDESQQQVPTMSELRRGR